MANLGLVVALLVLLSQEMQGGHRSLKTCAPGKELRRNGNQAWRCKRCKDGFFSNGGHQPRCRPCRTCTHGYKKKCSRKKNAVCKKLLLGDCIRMWITQQQEALEECRGQMNVFKQILEMKCRGKDRKKKHCKRKMMKKLLQYEYHSLRSPLVSTPTTRAALPTGVSTTAAVTAAATTTLVRTYTILSSIPTLIASVHNEANYEEQESVTQPPENEEPTYAYLAAGLAGLAVCLVVLLVISVILVRRRLAKYTQHGSTYSSEIATGDEGLQTRTNDTFNRHATTDREPVAIPITDHDHCQACPLSQTETSTSQQGCQSHEERHMRSARDLPHTVSREYDPERQWVNWCHSLPLSKSYCQAATVCQSSSEGVLLFPVYDNGHNENLTSSLDEISRIEHPRISMVSGTNLSQSGCPEKSNVQSVQGPENTPPSATGRLKVLTFPNPNQQHDQPVRSLAQGRGTDECTSPDTLLQRDINQTSSETEDGLLQRDINQTSSETEDGLLQRDINQTSSETEDGLLQRDINQTSSETEDGLLQRDINQTSSETEDGLLQRDINQTSSETEDGLLQRDINQTSSETEDGLLQRDINQTSSETEDGLLQRDINQTSSETEDGLLQRDINQTSSETEDGLLQRDINQTSSETEDEDYSLDSDSHSSAGSQQGAPPADSCLPNNCASKKSSTPSTKLDNFTNNLHYQKHVSVRQENVYGNMFTSKGTQTKHNHENTRTIFGYEWHKSADFTSMGGHLAVPQSDITLEVPRHAIPEGEKVCVQAFATAEFHNLQSFMDDDEVVVSPIGEFQMSYKRKWDRHVKIRIPCIQRNPKETFRVRFFQKTTSGNVELSDVPVKEEGLNQELYYVKKENHVEIFTVHFTGFLCTVCGHTCPIDLLALVFGGYGHHGNEAWITLVVGDRRNSIPEIRQRIIQKEKALTGSELVAERPIRLVEEYDCQSRLMFTLNIRSQAERWSNADVDSGHQQVRRLRELIRCSCPRQPSVTPSEFESHHQCEDKLQWVYSSDDPSPDTFSCKIRVEHHLNGDVVTPRQDACDEGLTSIIVPPVKLQRPHPSHQSKSRDDLPPMGFAELTSSKKPMFSQGTNFSSTKPRLK